MKKLMVVLVLMVFFLSCKKEEEEIIPTEDYNISGKVVDLFSGEPVPGAILVAISSKNGIVARDTTDAEGFYNLHYTLPADETAYLTILWGTVDCVELDYFDLEDGGFYLIETHASAYYKFALPPGYENIKIYLTTEASNVYSGPAGAFPFQVFETCNNTETFYITYSEYVEWTFNGSTYGSYFLVGQDTLTVPLTYGDTTVVVLP